MYQTYQKLSRTRSNTLSRNGIQTSSPAYIEKREKHLAAESEFKSSLNCLFDLNASNQSSSVKEKYLAFYNLQKQQSRISTISVLDCKAAKKTINEEKNEPTRKEKIQWFYLHHPRHLENFQVSLGRCTLSGSKQVSNDDDQFVTAPRPQGKIRIFDDVFCGIIEQHSMTSRPVYQLIVNVLEKLNVPLDCVVHNDRTLQR